MVGGLPVACDFQSEETHAASAAFTMEAGGINITCLVHGHTVDGSAGRATKHFATCVADASHDALSGMLVMCPASNVQVALHAQIENRENKLLEYVTYTCDETYKAAETSAASFYVMCRINRTSSAMNTCRNIDINARRASSSRSGFIRSDTIVNTSIITSNSDTRILNSTQHQS